MIRTYSDKQRLLTSHCDMLGAWKPSAILETMQDVSGAHSQLLGVGHDALRKEGLVWVVNRYELVMNRYPHFGDVVTLQTYPLSARHGFYTRYYAFLDESGQEYGYACGLWSLLDLQTRSMITGPVLADRMPDNRDLPAKLKIPGMAAQVQGDVQTASFAPQFTDMDDNLHVNNTKYLDWCVNALGIDAMQANELARFVINYQKEIRPGQRVQTQLCHSGDDFSYAGFVGDEHHFTISGKLRARSQQIQPF